MAKMEPTGFICSFLKKNRLHGIVYSWLLSFGLEICFAVEIVLQMEGHKWIHEDFQNSAYSGAVAYVCGK